MRDAITWVAEATAPAPIAPSVRLAAAKISDRLLRQALEEAEVATRHVIELTQQLIELRTENAELRAQLNPLRCAEHEKPAEIHDGA